MYLILFLASACCLTEGNLIASYRLTETDLSKIPYQDGDTMPFKHSEGFEFDVILRQENSFFSNQEGCEDYYESEILSVFLENEIPRLDIELSLYKYSDQYAAEFSISSDFTGFAKDTSIENQSLTINGITFNNVETYVSLYDAYPISEILYSSSNRILKLTYTDSTYVQINP